MGWFLFGIFVPLLLSLILRKIKREKKWGLPVETSGEPGYDIRNQRFTSLVQSHWEGVSTLAELFEQSCELYLERPLLGSRNLIAREIEVSKDGRSFEKLHMGSYEWLSYGEAFKAVCSFASGLVQVGHKKEERVAIFVDTQAEWQIALQGCFRRNVTVVTMYASFGEAALCHSLNETEVSTIICGPKELKRLVDISGQLDTVKRVIFTNDVGVANEISFVENNTRWSIISFLEVEKLGLENSVLAEMPVAADIAVIMYTSGSTGLPKGVVITHGNILATVSALTTIVPALGCKDVYLAYLPLAHILELATEVVMIAAGASIGYGSPLTLTDTSNKIKKGTKGDASALRPTLMTAVPAILDRFRDDVRKNVDAKGGVSKKLFDVAYGRRLSAINGSVFGAWGIEKLLWDFLVFRKVRAILGGHIRLVLSGGASFSGDTQRFINICLGAPIGHGYGLTETCAGGTFSECDDTSVGRVGAPLPCSFIKLIDWSEGGYLITDSPMPRGEIVIGGPNVTAGYFKNEEKTREVYKVDEKGMRWFYTGDIGRFHPDGCLEIIDHKDIVKLQHDEYVSLGKMATRTSRDYINPYLYVNPSFVESNLQLDARTDVLNLHKNTKKSFSETIKEMYCYFDERSGRKETLVADDVYKIIMKNATRLDSEINFDRDFEYTYCGLKTLERSYHLLKVYGKVVEKPQHMLMRVAVGIHKEDIDSAVQTYHLMSQRWFTHAFPTLINAGTPRPQLSSCFLVCMKDDSIEGIYDTLKECAVIRESAGEIGVSIHNISGANSSSEGIVPMLRVLNDTAQYMDQGGGKRNGAFTVYLEPWHPNIFEFLNLRKKLKNHGTEEHRARGLFSALWIPDLFMQRVKIGGQWSLFCPNESPGLADCWGDEFEKLYTRYEREGKAKKIIKAQDLWFKVLDSQIETETPYMLFKDTCNRKSNQQNLGTIKSSNLCTEIVEFTGPDETAVCNLASITLSRCVREKGVPIESHQSKMVGSINSKNRYFDFDKLAEVTAVVTVNLNRIIDINHYPVETAKKSNLRHRPIGIGVHGLADTFILLGMPFDSLEAKQLNKEIFETIYYHASKASSQLASRDGPYETYKGSPVSQGILQPDMWKVTPSNRWDWPALRKLISRNGMRNSLLVASMPTSSTSQILGNNESFEPYRSYVYCHGVLRGEYAVNEHLVHDLTEMDMWSPAIKKRIIYEDGSVRIIPEIPDHLKSIYKTVWEIKQRTVVDMAIDRGCYIDQSQSLNIYMVDPNFAKLTSLHFYAWSKGLKTGMYHLRTRLATDPIKFTPIPAKHEEQLMLEFFKAD